MLALVKLVALFTTAAAKVRLDVQDLFLVLFARLLVEHGLIRANLGQVSAVFGLLAAVQCRLCNPVDVNLRSLLEHLNDVLAVLVRVKIGDGGQHGGAKGGFTVAFVISGFQLLAFAIFLAVLVHKVPAAFSVGLFSMHERSERSDSIRDVVMFSIATPIMILLTFYLLGDVSGLMLGLAILFSGGTFLYVATVDVLPEVHHSATGKTALIQVITGALIMVAILWILHTTGMAAHSH